jgi:alpha-methylacyl-CoA racemase
MNYIALTGALDGLGQDQSRPHFPSNLVGDFGGGSTYLVIGVLSALHEVRSSGQGQVVDAAIVDGTAHLNAMASGFRAAGELNLQRGTNMLDGGLPWYDIYATSDGRHVSVGPLEPQFYAEFLRILGLEGAPPREDPANWPILRELFTAALSSRPLADWSEIFEGTDACVAPILTLDEAPHHPHLRHRGTFVERGGVTQPAPAPRFSRTPAVLGSPPPAAVGIDTVAALEAWGIADVADLLAEHVAVQT